MTVHIEDVLLYSLTQDGDRYIFGSEANASNPNPSAWDCSELIEWSCARAGVVPRVPDGSYYQWKHCTPISVARGVSTRGALLFVGDGRGVGRDAITHVAWSLGDGTTIEARGSRWGVGQWPTASRFDFAGLIPGISYSPRQPLESNVPLTDAEIMRIADVTGKVVLERLGVEFDDTENKDVRNRNSLVLAIRRLFGVKIADDPAQQAAIDTATGQKLQQLLNQ